MNQTCFNAIALFPSVTSLEAISRHIHMRWRCWTGVSPLLELTASLFCLLLLIRSTVLPSLLTPHSSLLTNSCYLSTYLTDNTPSVPIISSHVSVSHLYINRLLHNSHKWTFKMSNNTNPILDTRISVHPDFSGLHPSVKLVLPPWNLKRVGLESSGQN